MHSIPRQAHVVVALCSRVVVGLSICPVAVLVMGVIPCPAVSPASSLLPSGRCFCSALKPSALLSACIILRGFRQVPPPPASLCFHLRGPSQSSTRSFPQVFSAPSPIVLDRRQGRVGEWVDPMHVEVQDIFGVLGQIVPEDLRVVVEPFRTADRAQHSVDSHSLLRQ